MRQKLLPLLLFLLAPPVLAQDCSFTFNFTGDGPQTAIRNLSDVTPCVNWRITLSTTGSFSTTIDFQTSPNGGSWTSVGSAACSSSQQPPCVIQGANPIVGTQGMAYVAAYGSYVRVVASSSSGSGTGTVRGYGAKGASANAGSAGSGGGGGGPTSNQNLRFAGAYFPTASATTVCYNVGYAGTIGAINLWSDATITGTVDVKTVAFSSFTGPGSTSSITGGTPATITAATEASPSISGWSTSLSANTMVCFFPSAITAGSATYLTVQLQISAN